MSTSPAALSSPVPALPAILTPVLGRETELDHLQALIGTRSIRLITLTGPGGVGKTRLVLHLATTLMREFDRDVVFVPLALIRNADLVLPTIGQALGLLADASDTFRERLGVALAERSPLLVLDNFEQILEAAPIVATLLAQSPETTILVTSQTALGIPGEQRYPLSPLPTPATDLTTAEHILRSDAVALFIARAQAVKPDLAVDDPVAVTIAEICRRLDGLPLALELAAARINILSPEALLARLSNRLQLLGSERRGIPDRLRTMRHAIAWSYDLLTADEQALFRQTDRDRDVYGVLSALVDHSLLQAQPLPNGDTRFLMLETLRDYGIEQLEIRGEDDDARLAQATHILKLAETAEPHLTGRTQQAWLERLDPEWENVREALDWSITHGHVSIALRILGALWRFCSTRAHVSEGRAFLKQALDGSTIEEPAVRIRALYGAGFLAEDQRDLDVALAFFQQGQELAAQNAMPLLESQGQIGLGTIAHDRGDYVAANTHHAQALVLARLAGDQRSIGVALGNLAAVSYFQGNLDAAERNWEEISQLMRATGDIQTEALAVSNLGALASERGEFERARELLARALELQREMNSMRDIPYSLANLAEVWFRLGDYTLAEDLFNEAITALRDYADAGTAAIVTDNHARLVCARGDMPRAAAMILDSVGVLTGIGDRHSMVLNAETLAALCVHRQEHAVAVEFLAAAATIRAEIGATLNPVELAEVETLTSQTRCALGEHRFAAHWTAGTGMDFDALSRRMTIVARDIAGPSIAPSPTPVPGPPPIEHNLTNRELQVLRLLAEGRSTKEISDLLSISPRTTATHVTNILGKLEVTSRTAAVAWAMRAGLV